MAATKQAGDLSKLPRANSPNPMPQARGQKWYSRLTLSDRRSEGFEAIPGPENTIFSWAFDTASFELKPVVLTTQTSSGSPKSLPDGRVARWLDGLDGLDGHFWVV
jgi:hypothetical protein